MQHIKWPSIESFHNIRKYVNQYPHICRGNLQVTYRPKIKLHGTNACVQIVAKDQAADPEVEVLAQSRSTILNVKHDNAGFAAWVAETEANWRELNWWAVRQFVSKFVPGNVQSVCFFGEWAGCFYYDTPVLLADGSTRKIGLIVNGKEDVDVLTYNLETNSFEPKKIIGWLKKADNDDWVTITVKRRHRGGRSTRLIVTKNHKIFTKKESVIKEINAGDICENTTILVPGQLMSYYQKQFVMGSLLGDGSFNSYGHFCTQHSDDSQSWYNDFIANLLDCSVGTCVSGHGSNMRRFLTKSLPEIKNFNDQLIVNGVKTPNSKYLDKMQAPAFAAWYMDDGSLAGGHDGRQHQCELSTLGYSKEVNQELVAWFNAHGFSSYMCEKKSRAQYFLRFNPEGTEAFLRMIAPYVLKEFNFKLPEHLHSMPKINWQDKGPLVGLIETQVLEVQDGNPYSEGWKRIRYDIEVEDNHNYFANRVLVHNSGIQKGTALNQLDKKIFALFGLMFVVEGQELPLFVGSPAGIGSHLPEVPDTYVLPYGDEVTIDYSRSADELQATADILSKAVDEVEACDPWVKKHFGVEGIGEGLVYFPVSNEHLDRETFSNLVFKAKGEKHKVVKQKRSVQVNPETAASISEFVDLVVTEPRLEQGVTEVCDGEYLSKNIGKFIGWASKDVQKECQAELEASGLNWKQVAKSVSNKARGWYLNKIATT